MSQEYDPNISAAEARRQYILGAIKEDPERVLSFEEVQKMHGVVSDQTLHNDAKTFQKNGEPIAVSARCFIYDLSLSDTLKARRSHQRKSKRSIGNLISELIVKGPNDFAIPKDIRHKLVQLSHKSHRLIGLDAGTTNEHIARCICEHTTPDRHLSSLRILTNSAELCQLVRNSSPSPHGVIMIGGAIRSETDATCGILAERCLETLGVQPDLTIVGASGYGNLFFSCNNENEASMKSLLLSQAKIACIALDATKLVERTKKGAWPFAKFGKFLDIVFTNRIGNAQDAVLNKLEKVATENGACVIFAD